MRKESFDWPHSAFMLEAHAHGSWTGNNRQITSWIVVRRQNKLAEKNVAKNSSEGICALSFIAIEQKLILLTKIKLQFLYTINILC